MRYDPAKTVIDYLGGAPAVADFLKTARATVYKWCLAKTKQGTGGLIPMPRQM